MSTSRTVRTNPIGWICLCAFFLSTPLRCQTTRYVPPEFRASDPEVETLLESSRAKADSGAYESSFSDSKNALELAKKKGLIGDRAIAEDLTASGYAVFGDVSGSTSLYRAALQDAIASKNFFLQADVLVALSSTLPGVQGNLVDELELLNQAVDRTDQSKSPYIRARVLGEYGRVRIASGQIEAGRKSIEEALAIDRANNYGFEALHTVYAAYADLAQSQPDFGAAQSLLELASDLAIKARSYVVLVDAQTALAHPKWRCREGHLDIRDGS